MVPYRGTCKDFVHKWFFNTSTGMCETFVYGGCMGNNNRFDSQVECMHFCVGGETSEYLYIFLAKKQVVSFYMELADAALVNNSKHYAILWKESDP